MEVFNGISMEKLEEILYKIGKIHVALIGDICLDVYWQADMTKSELSRETPHFPLPIVKEWMSPGGGGNAAANIAALGPEGIKILGVVGRDWRGDALVKKLQEAGINTDSIVLSEKAVTNAYCKPIRQGISHIGYEDPRLDFNNYETLPCEDEAKLMELLCQCAGDVDVICISDQLQYGCITPIIREKIISLAKEGLRVVVDSRDRIGLYNGVILKPNEVEGMRAVDVEMKAEKLRLEDYVATAKILAERNKSKVCMTLGPKGCVYIDSGRTVHIPSYEVSPPIDICGAGDTFLSAFSCAVAAGAEPWEAASFANMAADVTIKKVGITGTASPEGIRERHKQIFSNTCL
jgi:D-glycero-beta-D-manno-heptose-7-phosphate kinase